jgi:enoyl-CoA hydratase/carnithine racemase
MPKPTIAAVQGHAVGAGFQLALACDLRVAGHDVKLGMLEARFGLIPDLGGPHRLTRLVGPARAKELIWTTRLVEAEESLRLGLVERVAPANAILEEAHRLAGETLRHSPLAVRWSKALVESAVEVPLDQHLAAALEAQTMCLRSDDHRGAESASLRGPEAGNTVT